MDGAVVEVLRGLKVTVDERPHSGCAIGKANCHSTESEGQEMLQQQAALSRLATAIYPFQDNESAAMRRSCDRFWRRDHCEA